MQSANVLRLEGRWAKWRGGGQEGFCWVIHTFMSTLKTLQASHTSTSFALQEIPWEHSMWDASQKVLVFFFHSTPHISLEIFCTLTFTYTCTFDSCFFSQKPDLEFSILSSSHGKRRCTFISFLLRLKLNGYNLLIMRWINTGVCNITIKQERTRN